MGSSQASPAPSRSAAGPAARRAPALPGACASPGKPSGRQSALCPLSHGLPEKDQRSARLPGAQHQSCRRPEKKRASVRSRSSKALFQAQRLTRKGERTLKPRFNSVGSQAVGAPPGQKGLSAGEKTARGPGGSIKGSCVPAALKFTFVLSPSQRKVTEGACGLSSFIRGLVDRNGQVLSPKMLGIQMKTELCSPACWDSRQCLYQ